MGSARLSEAKFLHFPLQVALDSQADSLVMHSGELVL